MQRDVLAMVGHSPPLVLREPQHERPRPGNGKGREDVDSVGGLGLGFA